MMPPTPTPYMAEPIPVLRLTNKRPSAAIGGPPSKIQKMDDGAGNIDPKGIAKCAIDQQIKHLHYKQCLFDNKMTVNDMNLIRSQNHVLYVICCF
jgi:hypothetical protein